MKQFAFYMMLAAYALANYNNYLTEQELIALKAHYAKMECVEVVEFNKLNQK